MPRFLATVEDGLKKQQLITYFVYLYYILVFN